MTSAIENDLTALAPEFGADLKHKGTRFTFEKVIAERKVMLSKKKLTFTAKVEVDEASRTVTMSEALKETGSGLGTGDGDAGPGFGFKTETYRTRGTERSGTIEEQSSLFGSRYDYSFDFGVWRDRVRAVTEAAGYTFQHHL